MWLRTLAIVIGLIALHGCGSGSGESFTAPRSVTVSWASSPETAVNSAGGGYRVYYSTDPNFVPHGAPAAVVPYAGAAAPSATLSLSVGTYYVRVVAYSSLPVPGGGTAVSAPSTAVVVRVP